ncbi:MAG: glycoside hydrolase family 5 protein [Lachnospiraceae bacterium]|nr:glycoside hydrolase family 5 protein [Lachnospiraceae bacterium]
MKKKTTMILLLVVLVLAAGCSGKAGIPAGDIPVNTTGESDMIQNPDDLKDEVADSFKAGGETEDSTPPMAEGKAEDSTAPMAEAETVQEETEFENGITIPEISIKDFAVPDTEALRFANGLGVGWNLGNTFDAYRDSNFGDEMLLETHWQSDMTTKEFIHSVREKGFSSIRIPVSWHDHLSEDLEISEAWISRVDEVVGWAVDEGLYVIINIHHDNHPEANGYFPDSVHREQSTRYVKRIWEQVADRFNKYDEHVIFESLNEPRLVGNKDEWYLNPGSKEVRDSVECINELNQLFVDTVRATGGNNAERYLMVPGYCASPDGVLSVFFKMPEDPAKDRLMLSVHAYTPYDFALQSPGIKDFDPEKKESTGEIDTFLGKLYMKYVMNGIPVVVGEFGAQNKNNLQARVDYAAYYVRAARARGMAVIWWDNNNFNSEGEKFGILSRKSPDNSVNEIVAALMKYAVRP